MGWNVHGIQQMTAIRETGETGTSFRLHWQMMHIYFDSLDRLAPGEIVMRSPAQNNVASISVLS